MPDAERYLVTRRTTDNPDVYEALPSELKETISEVHPDIGLGSIGTYGIDLDDETLVEVVAASNLIRLDRIGAYSLGYNREAQHSLYNLADEYESITPIVEGVELPSFDTGYPIEEAPFMVEGILTQRYYKMPKTGALDQGREGACTGFSVEHLLGSAPHMRKCTATHARGLYYRARQIDEWEGENYEGSSISAATRAAVEDGSVARWGMANSHLECIQWFLSDAGGIIYGMDWHEGMYVPNAQGYLRPTGRQTGGHAIYARGCNKWKDARMLNSWGKGWGYQGLAWISNADMEYMWNRGKIEAICAIEAPMAVR